MTLSAATRSAVFHCCFTFLLAGALVNGSRAQETVEQIDVDRLIEEAFIEAETIDDEMTRMGGAGALTYRLPSLPDSERERAKQAIFTLILEHPDSAFAEWVIRRLAEPTVTGPVGHELVAPTLQLLSTAPSDRLKPLLEYLVPKLDSYEFLQPLATLVETHEDEAVRNAAESGFRRLVLERQLQHDEGSLVPLPVIERLFSIYVSEDDDVRSNVWGMLREALWRRARDDDLWAFYDSLENKAIKEAFLFLIGVTAAPESEKRLIEVLTTNPDSGLRINAAHALGWEWSGGTPFPEAYPALYQAALIDRDVAVRLAAIESLGDHHADSGITERKQRELVRLLADLLKNAKTPEERMALADAMVRCWDCARNPYPPDVRGERVALIEHLLTEADPTVQSHLASSIQTLVNRPNRLADQPFSRRERRMLSQLRGHPNPEVAELTARLVDQF